MGRVPRANSFRHAPFPNANRAFGKGPFRKRRFISKFLWVFLFCFGGKRNVPGNTRHVVPPKTPLLKLLFRRSHCAKPCGREGLRARIAWAEGRFKVVDLVALEKPRFATVYPPNYSAKTKKGRREGDGKKKSVTTICDKRHDKLRHLHDDLRLFYDNFRLFVPY